MDTVRLRSHLRWRRREAPCRTVENDALHPRDGARSSAAVAGAAGSDEPKFELRGTATEVVTPLIEVLRPTVSSWQAVTDAASSAAVVEHAIDSWLLGLATQAFGAPTGSSSLLLLTCAKEGACGSNTDRKNGQVGGEVGAEVRDERYVGR